MGVAALGALREIAWQSRTGGLRMYGKNFLG
jgi:hypothetical protein